MYFLYIYRSFSEKAIKKTKNISAAAPVSKNPASCRRRQLGTAFAAHFCIRPKGRILKIRTQRNTDQISTAPYIRNITHGKKTAAPRKKMAPPARGQCAPPEKVFFLILIKKEVDPYRGASRSVSRFFRSASVCSRAGGIHTKKAQGRCTLELCYRPVSKGRSGAEL